VVAGAEGTDLLNGIAKVSDGAGHHFLLVGNGGYATDLAAINLQSGDTLVLAHSLTQPFSGVISGLADVHQQIDLKDFTFTDGSMRATTPDGFVNGDTTLVVSNTSTNQSVTFTLAGDYTHSTWNFAQDSGTGTLFHDPPATHADVATVPVSVSTDLAQTVTAALNLQGATLDQFTFQADNQSGTLAVGSTSRASGEAASATDAATLDTTASSSSDHQPTATATTDASAHTGLTSNVATNSPPAADASASNGTQAGTITQTASASPAATTPNGDTFVFAANFGHETITNFHPDTDVIQIDHAVFADLHAVLAAAHDDGSGNAVITANPNDAITIQNVTVAQLVQHQGDFHFT
jgi:hypothetical protein